MNKNEALRMAIEWLDNQQLGYSGHSVRKACQEALAETQEADLSKCPKCGGEADNGHDRCIPPSPYYCTKCNETQEAVCWMMTLPDGNHDWILDGNRFEGYIPLYTTPPSREWQSLSDEEIGRLAVFDGLHHVEIPLLAKFIIAIDKALRKKNELFGNSGQFTFEFNS